jgi:hypothetical protein
MEADLSTGGPVFSYKAFYVGFVVDYVIPKQDTLSVSPVSIIPSIAPCSFFIDIPPTPYDRIK